MGGCSASTPRPVAASSARPGLLHRLAVLALASLGGAVIGLVGSFTHQSLPPVGLLLGLTTVGLYTAGLRAWGDDRGPALAGALGISAVALALASPGAGASVVIPNNWLGYGWSLGVMLIALLVIAWPRVQRAHRRPGGSIEESASEEKEQPAP